MPDAMMATFHPAANIFPLMTGTAFDDLVASVKASGLLFPIVELDNAILDGRNRYRACIAAGVPIKAVKFKGADPVRYVIDANLHRRQMNESQRAMAAARMANLPDGVRSDRSANLQTLAISQPQAAKTFGISTRSVADARKVQEHAIPRLAERVDAGEVAVSLVATLAELPIVEQEAMAEADEADLRNAAKASRRAGRERDLGEATRAASAALGQKRYPVIYADPPWRFETRSPNGLDRAADNHYPTMSLAEIRALEVPAADDCVLFLWATVPMLPQALSVMDVWGFDYKSHCIWLKDRLGTGYWFRNAHEVLLVGTRGSVPAPAPGAQFNSFIEAPVSDHSAKPLAFAEMIEEMFPTSDLLEMFARGPRLGWDTWGNEAGTVDAMPAEPAAAVA